MPVTFDKSTFYPLDELREMLHGSVGLNTFLDRLGLRNSRVFKGGVWGFEVLEAARKTPPFSEVGDSGGAQVVGVGARPGRSVGKNGRGLDRKLTAGDVEE